MHGKLLLTTESVAGSIVVVKKNRINSNENLEHDWILDGIFLQ